MVRKVIIMLIYFIFIGFLGCTHKVDVGTKEPIAVDVKMRVDVYHHVQKQANYIEDMVSGKKPIPEETKGEGNSSKLELLTTNTAYAQPIEPGKFTPRMLKAIKSRRQRYEELTKWESNGVIMEGRNGYVSINDSALKSYPEEVKNKVRNIVNNENHDRKIIYQEVAKMNDLTVSEVGRQFSYTHKKKAPPGTWIQVQDASGNWVWKRK